MGCGVLGWTGWKSTEALR